VGRRVEISAAIAGAGLPVGDDPAAFGIDHSHHDADALAISVDAVNEDW
jgi:hypothetical protein